jgi:hypothetical protein
MPGKEKPAASPFVCLDLADPTGVRRRVPASRTAARGSKLPPAKTNDPKKK